MGSRARGPRTSGVCGLRVTSSASLKVSRSFRTRFPSKNSILCASKVQSLCVRNDLSSLHSLFSNHGTARFAAQKAQDAGK